MKERKNSIIKFISTPRRLQITAQLVSICFPIFVMKLKRRKIESEGASSEWALFDVHSKPAEVVNPLFLSRKKSSFYFPASSCCTGILFLSHEIFFSATSIEKIFVSLCLFSSFPLQTVQRADRLNIKTYQTWLVSFIAVRRRSLKWELRWQTFFWPVKLLQNTLQIFRLIFRLQSFVFSFFPNKRIKRSPYKTRAGKI